MREGRRDYYLHIDFYHVAALLSHVTVSRGIMLTVNILLNRLPRVKNLCNVRLIIR